MYRYGVLAFFALLQMLLSLSLPADSYAAPALAGSKAAATASPLSRSKATATTAVAQPPRPPQTYTLSGYITDPSGVPWSGAVIVAGQQQQTTGANGIYRFGGLQPGRTSIYIYPNAQELANRHTPKIREALNINSNTQKNYILTIPNTGTLRGKINDAASGAPLAGVVITIGEGQSTATRGDGSYSISGLKLDNPHSKTSGSKVTASKAGYEPRQQYLFISKETVLNMGMAPVGTVQKYIMEGYVVDPSGVPFSGAVLVAANHGSSRQQVIGPDGAFRVADLVLGDNVIRIYASMQQLAEKKSPTFQELLNITGNTKRNFTLILPNTATLKGSIRDAATGAPIPAATITVKGKSVQSGTDGGYSMSRIPLDSNDLRDKSQEKSIITVFKPGYASRQASMYILGDSVLELGLAPNGNSQSYTLSGYITDPSGVPFHGAIIFIDKQQQTIGPDGRYSFGGLQLDKVSVNIYPNAQELADRHAPKIREALNINGNMQKNYILTIPNTGTLRGKVIDAATGAPVSGATITIDEGPSTISKADGSYSVSGLKLDNPHSKTGSSKVTASIAGYTARQEWVVILNDTVKDFQLTKAGGQ